MKMKINQNFLNIQRVKYTIINKFDFNYNKNL